MTTCYNFEGTVSDIILSLLENIVTAMKLMYTACKCSMSISYSNVRNAIVSIQLVLSIPNTYSDMFFSALKISSPFQALAYTCVIIMIPCSDTTLCKRNRVLVLNSHIPYWFGCFIHIYFTCFVKLYHIFSASFTFSLYAVWEMP